MSDPTDTELLKRWEAYERAVAVAGRETDDLRRTREHIEIDFEALIQRRAKPQLTDDSRLRAVVEAITQQGKWKGVPIEYGTDNAPANDPRRFTWVWNVYVIAADVARGKWEKFINAIEDEIALLEEGSFVYPSRWGWIDDGSESTHEDPDSSGDYTATPETISAAERARRRYAIFPVNTLVWEGPPGIRQRLKKSWEKPSEPE